MSDHEKYSSPDEETIEALFELVYENDADAVADFLDRHRISANVHLLLGDMPLLHAAVDAETEAAIHDRRYVPTDRTIRMLLERGSDPTTQYLGRTAEDASREKGLRAADAAFAEHAQPRNDPGAITD